MIEVPWNDNIEFANIYNNLFDIAYNNNNMYEYITNINNYINNTQNINKEFIIKYLKLNIEYLNINILNDNKHSILNATTKLLECFELLTHNYLKNNRSQSILNTNLIEINNYDQTSYINESLCLKLIQIVNLIIDDLKKKKKTSQNMFEIAKEINFPQYIVEIRHAGAHKSAPKSMLILKGILDCMKYVKEYWWDKQLSLYVKEEFLLHKIINKCNNILNYTVNKSNNSINCELNNNKIYSQTIDINKFKSSFSKETISKINLNSDNNNNIDNYIYIPFKDVNNLYLNLCLIVLNINDLFINDKVLQNNSIKVDFYKVNYIINEFWNVIINNYNKNYEYTVNTLIFASNYIHMFLYFLISKKNEKYKINKKYKNIFSIYYEQLNNYFHDNYLLCFINLICYVTLERVLIEILNSNIISSSVKLEYLITLRNYYFYVKFIDLCYKDNCSLLCIYKDNDYKNEYFNTNKYILDIKESLDKEFLRWMSFDKDNILDKSFEVKDNNLFIRELLSGCFI